MRAHPREVYEGTRVVLALWDELRARRGPYRLRMHGTSMWPAAPPGSILAVTPCDSRALVPGDLVTFRAANTIVTHRVRAVRSDGSVVAWGDTIADADAPIAAEDVLGRAIVESRGALVTGANVVRLALRFCRATLRRARAA